ncbi:hypothetical protein JYU34_014187 [Plutella xylostella]|uniref:Peptidase M12B domain-containing protein n=1 Tax=Plutella xylostella TaxID=51655 RepID=A0ABQ7Q7R1_PLUXY|nr:hypothetical protein JYU34_014187 [Plutella xylostella]
MIAHEDQNSYLYKLGIYTIKSLNCIGPDLVEDIKHHHVCLLALGMRHDGPLADNGCDPSAYIMSPTLGSGKITWSQCSRTYLQKFLDTIQSRCLLDHGNSAGQLDHSAEGILPGERFDADQQCMLKYGRGSRHSSSQSLEDICRDLHCQRERHTWTSHPALEGTKCGHDMYCRGGECVERYGSATPSGAWGRWGGWSECASSCLLDERHSAAAAGIAVATRRCNRFRHDSGSSYCSGSDKKYQTCNAQQCNNVPRLTVREFADQICRRAREVDPDLIGTGLQRMDSDDVSSSCAVWCDTRGGGYKSRGWTLPDGARCSRHAPHYCIAGSCQVSVYTVRYKSRGWTLPDGARCSRHAPHYCIAGSCQVSVYTVRYKSRGWTLPDGARCSRHAPHYCIAGSCQVSVYTVRYKSRGWTLPDGARCSRHAPHYCIAGSCQVSVYTVRYKSRGWTLPDGARCSRHAPHYCIAGSCQVSVYTVRYKSRGWTLPDGARCSRHAPHYCIAGSCQVSVYTVRYKSRGWTLPDGARCSRHAPHYCIAGSCQVSVYTVRYKSRGWTLPDGARCSCHAPHYCIAGSCQKFSCSPHVDSQFSLTPSECEWEALQLQTATPHTSTKSSGTWRRAVGSQWRAVSGCHYHCVSGGSGVRLVRAAGKQTTSIQLCRPDTPSARLGCSQRKTPYQYATMVCTKYKERVRRLSGLGMQISPALEDPDRPCRVACQDEGVSHRFYLVNGQEGWFPLGTACGKRNTSYCVSGKCLEFGPDNTPLSEMVFTLPLLNRTTHSAVRRHSSRHRRSLQREKVVVTATLKQSHLDHIIKHLNFTENKNEPITYFEHIPEHIEVDFNNPIHIAPEETMFGKIPKPRWDRQIGTLSQYTRV